MFVLHLIFIECAKIQKKSVNLQSINTHNKAIMQNIKTAIIILAATLFISPVGKAQQLEGIAQDSRYNHVAFGVGFDLAASLSALNVGIPLEIRFGTIDDQFDFHFGERVSFHNGGDSALYFDPTYNLWLMQPTVGFTQFSTYAGARWNFAHSGDYAFFLGASYYLNFNARQHVDIDVPEKSYINNQYVYTSSRGESRYRFPDLTNKVTHTLRIETGLETAFFEFSIFASIDLRRNYRRSSIIDDIYYDPSGTNGTISSQPLQSYDAINLYSMEDLRTASRDVLYFGINVKFFFGSGYFRNSRNDSEEL